MQASKEKVVSILFKGRGGSQVNSGQGRNMICRGFENPPLAARGQANKKGSPTLLCWAPPLRPPEGAPSLARGLAPLRCAGQRLTLWSQRHKTPAQPRSVSDGCRGWHLKPAHVPTGPQVLCTQELASTRRQVPRGGN